MLHGRLFSGDLDLAYLVDTREEVVMLNYLCLGGVSRHTLPVSEHVLLTWHVP